LHDLRSYWTSAGSCCLSAWKWF